MHPKDQIQQDLKTAMKTGDVKRREVLRLLMAAFKQVEVDRRIELSEEDVLDILLSEVKKRRETIEDMQKAGRADSIEEEQFALSIVETYLPKKMTHEEIVTVVEEVAREVGATSPKDMSNVMRVVMPRVKGKADGKEVSAVVQEVLRR